MEINFKQIFKSFLSRDWIQKGEGKLTYVQLFGFTLITLGIIYFASFFLPSGIIDILPFLKPKSNPESSEVPIAFFTIMLGVSFAFPDMLKGQTKDISTMRIIVFMFANVICMLFLKIGWDKASLEAIRLDGYWVSIIAFLFGAKAAQSYFENANKIITQPIPNQGSADKNELGISQIAIAQIAKVQNEEKLHEQFSSIEFVSDTLKDGVSCLTIYIKDNNIAGIPSYVTAQINETTLIKVKTEIVTNIGEGKPHFAQLTNNIANSNTSQLLGSICGLVESTINPNLKGVLTSGHIFTQGKFIDFDGFVDSEQAHDTLSNGNSIGELYFQQMIPNQDIAVVKLNNTTAISTQLKKFSAGFYNVSQSDLNLSTKNVTILSKENNQRDAFIIDMNVSMRLHYDVTQKIMRNIILIGSDTDKNKSTTVSTSGDSGSCVYHKDSGKMIGMLLGGNDKFSFVLPFEQTLLDHNFKLK
ncbi:MAG: hypothetical protein U0Y10_09670 [Spirosomataceae bacterium]